MQTTTDHLRRRPAALYSPACCGAHYKPHYARRPEWCAGTCYFRADLLQGRLAEAVDAYERALAAAPNFEIVRNNLAIALTELGTRTKLDGEDRRKPRPQHALVPCVCAMGVGLLVVMSAVVMRIKYMLLELMLSWVC